MITSYEVMIVAIPGGLVVRIWRSHRHGRGSIPRLGDNYVLDFIDVC